MNMQSRLSLTAPYIPLFVTTILIIDNFTTPLSLRTFLRMRDVSKVSGRLYEHAVACPVASSVHAPFVPRENSFHFLSPINPTKQ